MNEIVLSRDGVWPFVWNWRARAEWPPCTHIMSGQALTKDRAHAKARRALDTVEVHTPERRLKAAA